MWTLQVNKFPHAHFTTKIGIHQSLQQLHWFTNFSMNSFFPRCYQVHPLALLHTRTGLPTYFFATRASIVIVRCFLRKSESLSSTITVWLPVWMFSSGSSLTSLNRSSSSSSLSIQSYKTIVTKHVSAKIRVCVHCSSNLIIKSKCDQQLIKKIRECKQLNHIKQMWKSGCSSSWGKNRPGQKNSDWLQHCKVFTWSWLWQW